VGIYVAAALATAFALRDQRDALLLVASLGVVGFIIIVATSSGSGLSPASWSTLRSAVRKTRQGDAPQIPPNTSNELVGLYEELVANAERAKAMQLREARSERGTAVTGGLRAGLASAVENVATHAEAELELTASIRTLINNLSEFAGHIDVLAGSANASNSAVLNMGATNEQVGSSISTLASMIRETVASIEEMTYAIREVATNTDALSLTAEETSTSMHQMDDSIDQVQSNANETARLSEEVAQDAQRGADAILKTIGEIYRIKEGSEEAVAVISNLGSRIEAVGQILTVIEEVAEQTNLLALNAAIIAAQAGEHGKGFAVVADEIKDLADRAAASTREIAQLIRTIQHESRNAIQAVEQGAENVERGVDVSNEAERALKKILASSNKSTQMVRTIARATVQQSKGSKQVTDAIGRIAETTQQIAAATAQQARGSELIMKSGDKMRTIAQQVERSSEEQMRCGRQVSQAMENINGLVEQLNRLHTQQLRGSEQALGAAEHGADVSARQERALRELLLASKRLQDLLSEHGGLDAESSLS